MMGRTCAAGTNVVATPSPRFWRWPLAALIPPTEAGEPVTLLVSATLDQLTTGIGQALVDGHLSMSAGQIRRMACDAKAAPMVFGTASEVLDVGRTIRTVPRSLRRALIHRDRGCSFPGCDRKAKWSQAHHIVEWSNGGPTTLDNLTLVCQHHRVSRMRLRGSDVEARVA
ncbi:DUF222 domain-containing protein [Saccharomonospora sp. NPDC046836]|uniref:HNH endonuclease signature motif containing protein n=1 Tax=Saccharomonospora sp. NPDC046836 TaxID=3156921 RepID=UPI0033E82BB2